MPIKQYSLNFKTIHDPKSLGMDSDQLITYGEKILSDFPSCKQALVTRRGKLVYRYHNSTPRIDPRMLSVSVFYSLLQLFIPHITDTKLNNRGEAWNGRSVAKCVLSALTGIALEKGIIRSLDQPLDDFLLGIPHDKRNITLYQLLTMTSGMPFTDKIPEMPRWLRSKNWIMHLLTLPLITRPGEKFGYSTANTHLLAGVLNNQLNGKLYEFAHDEFFTPLGLGKPYWEIDPQGIPFGGANLFLPIEDMLKIGYLYLQEGQWEGKQVIPRKWVRESTSAHIHARDQYEYGYAWWLRNFHHPASKESIFVYSALGWAGQRIYVIPQYEIVVAAISLGDLWAKTENLDVLLGQFVIPAVG